MDKADHLQVGSSCEHLFRQVTSIGAIGFRRAVGFGRFRFDWPLIATCGRSYNIPPKSPSLSQTQASTSQPRRESQSSKGFPVGPPLGTFHVYVDWPLPESHASSRVVINVPPPAGQPSLSREEGWINRRRRRRRRWWRRRRRPKEMNRRLSAAYACSPSTSTSLPLSPLVAASSRSCPVAPEGGGGGRWRRAARSWRLIWGASTMRSRWGCSTFSGLGRTSRPRWRSPPPTIASSVCANSPASSATPVSGRSGTSLRTPPSTSPSWRPPGRSTSRWASRWGSSTGQSLAKKILFLIRSWLQVWSFLCYQKHVN